jgi:hypothetical protein
VKDISIPPQLSKNDRDRRGFPIPFIVYRDGRGTPHFTIDDVGKLALVLAEERCGLCGGVLEKGQMWLIGGPVSAFAEDGLFTTPPAHEECARYAVQVCPFLAAPDYSRLIEDRTLKAEAVRDEDRFHHDGITPPRPLVFVLARTRRIALVDSDDGSGKKYILPHRPWERVEFWLRGGPISREDAEDILRDGAVSPHRLKWWPAGK